MKMFWLYYFRQRVDDFLLSVTKAGKSPLH